MNNDSDILIKAAVHRDHLAEQVGHDLKEKYDKGQQEHGGYLPDKGAAFLCHQARLEFLDGFVYVATLESVLAEMELEIAALRKENAALLSQRSIVILPAFFF